MFGILSFYIKLVAISCFSNPGFSLKIAQNTRLGERVCSLEDAMRMVKMKPKSMDLETAMQKFLLVKESQLTGEETMKDYRNCLARFLTERQQCFSMPLPPINCMITLYAGSRQSDLRLEHGIQAKVSREHCGKPMQI